MRRFLIGACAAGSVGCTEPKAGVTGTYVLTRWESQPLPAVIPPNGGFPVWVVGGSISLRKGGEYTWFVRDSLICHCGALGTADSSIITADTYSGGWRLDGTALTMTPTSPPGAPNLAFLEGDSIRMGFDVWHRPR